MKLTEDPIEVSREIGWISAQDTIESLILHELVIKTLCSESLEVDLIQESSKSDSDQLRSQKTIKALWMQIRSQLQVVSQKNIE